MKRFIIGLITALVVVLGGATAASAYPPEPDISVSTQTPTFGGSIAVTVQGCPPGSSVSFQLGSSSSTATADANGQATGSVTAPSQAGTFQVTATCGDLVQSASVTVVAPTPAPLPATGGGGFGTTLPVALALVVLGLMILGVAQIRRRSTTLA